ncbi:hypothetical protein YC2023_050461 [Brassica napus]
MRCLRACNRSMLIDMCVLVWLLACTPDMHPDMWEEWWRPACVLDMQPDMCSTRCRRACVRSHAKRHTGCHHPEADWLVSPINTPRPQLIYSHPDLSKPSQFSTDFESAPRDGSVQLNSSRPLSYFDDQVEMLSGVSSDPQVQISRSSARYTPGSPKNCPEAKGGSVRVQISLSRPVSFFMVKPRFCPSRDQFSPVQSSRPLGFGHVLSDQPATSRLEHCELVLFEFRLEFRVVL